MPAIEHITVQGFKSIEHLEELPLRPINVLIGPNGSGKSNFIGVFELLQALREGRLQDYVSRSGGADRVLHFGAKMTDELKLRVAFEDEINQYEIALFPTDDDGLYTSAGSELVHFWDKNRHADSPYVRQVPGSGNEAGISTSDGAGIEDHVRRHLGGWRIYHFHDTSPSSSIKRIGDLHDNRFLRPDGANLAAFLYGLRRGRSSRSRRRRSRRSSQRNHKGRPEYQMIRDTVRQAAPFFDDFQLEPLELNEDKIRLEWRHRGSDAYFNAASFSDGTLRFIALATLLLQPVRLRPSVILLDEPELGLHPYAITLLASLVKQASVETQIILATQSPILLDHFEPEDVLVADRVDGGTCFTRLGSEQLAVWLEDYSLGQLWEKNELGGRPARE